MKVDEWQMMGKLVPVRKVYWRRSRLSNEPNVVRHKYWDAVNIEPRYGWIVGFRTIYDGDTIWSSVEDPYSFLPRKQRKAVLVCFSPRENAVQVPFEEVFPEEGNDDNSN